MFRGWAELRGVTSLLCVYELVPSWAWAWAPAAGLSHQIPAPCQLEDGSLGALLSLLWRRLPVPLGLLHLIQWGQHPGGH